MMTIHGVRKPSWRAFEMLHLAGDSLVQDTLLTPFEKMYINKMTMNDANYTTVDVLATINSTDPSVLQVFVYHSHYLC